MNLNILRQLPKFHRELFLNGKPKEFYTMENLWDYYQLSFLGKNDMRSASQFVTQEELDRRKESLLSEGKELTLEDKALLNSLINQFGLEIILYAIDEYSAGDSSEILPVEKLKNYTYSAKNFYLKLENKKIVW
jgi:hypothetical protein